jgi:ureidoglycolate hydrolase
MRQVEVQPLEWIAFQPFGEFSKLEEDIPVGFYPDLMQLPLGSNAVTTISLAVVGMEKRADMLEYHHFTSEGLMPLDDDCDILVGKPVPGNPFAAVLHAFRVPKGTFVKLNPGTVHASQYSVMKKTAHVLLVLPAFTYGNDTEWINLSGEQQVIITEGKGCRDEL